MTVEDELARALALGGERTPTTAHPLCTCLVQRVDVRSLLGAWTDDPPPVTTEGHVTDDSRRRCPMHGPEQ